MRRLPHVLLLALAAGAGCSCGEERAAEVLPLLARTPDARVEEPGALEPAAEVGWGARGLAGWRKDTALAPDGTRSVATNQARASLALPATDPRDRTLRLVAWRAEDGEGALRLALNGADLGAHALGSEPRPLSVDAPAALWRAGQNVLTLDASSAAGSWSVVHVARLDYGTPCTIGGTAGAPRLAPGTGLVYRVEAPAARALRVRGEALGPGRLDLRVGALDTATGRTDSERFAPAARSVARGALDLRLPLPAWDDRVLELELDWHAEGGAELALAALDLEEARALPRPPVVLVSVDTLAARHMSLFGYERPTTPALRRFAAEAVVFDHCLANAPWTLPSYLSLMTGEYPRAHLVDLATRPDVVLEGHDYWEIAENRWTLAEALRGRGYETVASVDSHWLLPNFGFDQGFDLYDVGPVSFGPDDPLGGIDLIVRQVDRWLGGRADPARPLFLFAHALDCHGPYWPEAQWRDAFPAEPRTLVPAGGAFRTYRSIPVWMAMTAVATVDDAALIPSAMPLEPLVARYDETILEMDAYLARLFDVLRRHGLYDPALIVVTADHGESFAHRHYDHGELWEDVLHVPLVVKLPHGAFAGRRVTSSVQLVDLYPTLLDALGLQARREGLHGRSLLPLVRGEEEEPRVLFSEGGFARQSMVCQDGWKLIEREPALDTGDGALLTHPLVPDEWLRAHFPALLERALTDELLAELRTRPDFAARTAELRALLRGPFLELYDLARDPGETRDLARDEPERVARLLSLLRREQERQSSARALADPSPFPEPLSEEELAALHKLGYGGPGEGAAPR